MGDLRWEKLEFAAKKDNIFKRQGHSAVLSGSKIYVTAGCTHGDDEKLSDLRDMQILDVSTSQVQTKQLPHDFKGCRFHTADLVGNIIYFVGGFTGVVEAQSIGMRSCMTYDTKQEVWDALQIKKHINFKSRDTATVFERYSHCSAVNPTNKHQIFIFGGSFRKEVFGDLILLDVKMKQVTLIDPPTGTLCPQPRHHASMAAVGSSLCLYGGIFKGRPPVAPNKSLCIYDCLEEEWVYVGSGGSTKPVRFSHRAVTAGQQMVVLGGFLSRGVPTVATLDLTLGSCANDPGLEWSYVEAPSSSCMGEVLPERLCHAVVTKGKTLYVIGGSMKDKANKNLYPESWTVEMGIATVPATTAAPQRMVASPLKSPPKSAPLPRKAAAGAGKRSRPQAKSRPKAAARKASPVEQEQEANKSKWIGRKRQKHVDTRPAPKSLKALGNLSESGSEVDLPVQRPERQGRLNLLPAEDPAEEDPRVAELEAKLAESDAKSAEKDVTMLELRNDLQDEKDKAKRSADAMEDLKVEIRSLTERLRQDQQGRQREGEAHEKRQKELTSDVAELRRDKAELKNTMGSLKAHKTALQLEVENCKADLDKVRGEVETERGEKERMRREKDAAMETFQASSRRSGEEIADVKGQLQEARRKTEAYVIKCQEAEEKLEKERQVAAAAKSKATQVELQLGEVNEEAAAAKEQAQARVQEEKQRADAAVKKHALDKDLIDRLKAEKEVVMQQKRAADGKREDLEKRLQERMQDLEDTQTKLQRYKDHVWKKLKEREDDSIAERKALSGFD